LPQKVGRREKLAEKVGRREIYPPFPSTSHNPKAMKEISRCSALL